MSGKVVRVLIGLLIVSLVSYVICLNLQQVKVILAPGTEVESRMGLVLIFSFCAGLVSALFFALLIGIGSRLRARKANKELLKIRAHYALITKAREQLALGDFSSAKTSFRKIIEENPDDIAARVLYAETYSRQGDFNGALSVLDDARVEQKKNVELLLLAADINSTLGNHTAAYDNAALVLKLAPKNKFALSRLVHDCADLGRFSEAIDYQKQLLKQSPHEQQQDLQEELAKLELELAHQQLVNSTQAATNKAGYKQDVIDILRKHRGFAPALSELARIEAGDGKLDAATKCWQDAYIGSGDPQHLEQAAMAWLEIENPTKAVAAVRNGLNKRTSQSKNTAEGCLLLVRLLLNLENIEEAKKELDSLDKQEIANPELQDSLAIAKVRYLARVGKIEKALSELLVISERLSGHEFGKASNDPLQLKRSNSPLALTWQGGQTLAEPPHPTLSTP